MTMERIIIREEKAEDVRAIFGINKAAFGREDESLLIDRLRSGKEFIPELSLVAENKIGIVGHILFSEIRIKGQEDHVSLALAPMAVLPEFQNRGIGTMLVREGLRKAKALKYESVIVLGHKTFYSRFGFKPASKWGILCPFEVPDEAFMGIELTSNALENRSGVVVYPKAFLEVI